MRTVLILLDSLNRRHLKAYDPNARGLTPHLDAFAEDCAVFDNHFIGSAPCMPARRDIFTGRMHFLERGWGGVEPFDITLPDVLRKNGVFTHIATDHAHYFEIGGENYCCAFNTWDFIRGQETDPWVSRVHQPTPDQPAYGRWFSQQRLNQATFVKEEDYPTPKTFRAACDWVRANKGSDDFFLMVEGFDPHEPFESPAEYLTLFERDYTGPQFNWSSYAPVTEPHPAVAHLENTYLATMAMADRWLGVFLDTLKETGMYEDTLIIFTTDHGHMLGEHGFTGKNYMHAYNELSHIPLMVRWPDRANAGRRFAGLTQNTDLMPTILAHYGCPVPDRVKGYDLRRQIEGQIPQRRQVIYGWFGRAVNVCDGRYTYFRAPQSADNTPCYQYCAMPSTAWRYFDEEYTDRMEFGRFLRHTSYPVYKIPLLKGKDDADHLDYVMCSQLFDIKADYAQRQPLRSRQLEDTMCKKLAEGMRDADSPAEQYIRLGIEKYNGGVAL